MKINNSTYLSPCLSIKENCNEFAVSFQCSKDISQLVNRKDLNNNSIISNTEYFQDIDEVISYFNNDLEKNDNRHKSMSSIYRAKSTIYDLINSNIWEYFVTITFNPTKSKEMGLDLTKPQLVQKFLTTFIKNQNRKINSNIEYVLIPEYHENGNVHFHGVLRGLNKKDLKQALNNQEFLKDDNNNLLVDDNNNPIPNKYYQTPLTRNGNSVYNWQPFSKYGFTDFEEIRNKSRIGSYCTKYINKELEARSNEFGAHLYICSNGLNRSKKVYKKELSSNYLPTIEEVKKVLPHAYVIKQDYQTKIIVNKNDIDNLNKLIEVLSNLNIPQESQIIENNVTIDNLVKNQLLDNIGSWVRVGSHLYMCDKFGIVHFKKVNSNTIKYLQLQLENVGFRDYE